MFDLRFGVGCSQDERASMGVARSGAVLWAWSGLMLFKVRGPVRCCLRGVARSGAVFGVARSGAV